MYRWLFTSKVADLGQTKIDTGTTSPIKQHPRQLPIHMEEEADRHVDDLLKRRLIEESSSPWSSPVVLVKKKDGTTSFFVDYRKLDKRHCQRCILSSEDRWFTVPVVRRKILLDFRLDFGLLASRSSRKVRSSKGKGFTVLRSCLSGFVMPQRRLNV